MTILMTKVWISKALGFRYKTAADSMMQRIHKPYGYSIVSSNNGRIVHWFKFSTFVHPIRGKMPTSGYDSHKPMGQWMFRHGPLRQKFEALGQVTKTRFASNLA